MCSIHTVISNFLTFRKLSAKLSLPLITTLGLTEDNNARNLLMQALELVRPIMSKRGWHIHVLAEFFPRQTNLLGLNWNKGERIEIRVREGNKASNSYVFKELFCIPSGF